MWVIGGCWWFWFMGGWLNWFKCGLGLCLCIFGLRSGGFGFWCFIFWILNLVGFCFLLKLLLLLNGGFGLCWKGGCILGFFGVLKGG